MGETEQGESTRQESHMIQRLACVTAWAGF